MPLGGTVKAKAFINNGASSGETVSVEYDLAPSKWNVKDGGKENHVTRVIDGDPRTAWMSKESDGVRDIIIDLGEAIDIKGFTYTPRQDGKNEGIIYQYNFYVSDNGSEWKSVSNNASFANIRNNPIQQTVRFNQTHNARYIRLEALSTVNEKEKVISAAEVGVVTR
jgi:alpha-L-fucosidase